MPNKTDAWGVLLHIAKFRNVGKHINLTYSDNDERGKTYEVRDSITGDGVLSDDPIKVADWLLRYQPSIEPEEPINREIFEELGEP